jgi:hypothetical protein
VSRLRRLPLCLVAMLLLVPVGCGPGEQKNTAAPEPSGGDQIAAIKRVAMAYCAKNHVEKCRWNDGMTKISSSDPRYARTHVYGPPDDGQILRRPDPQSDQWAVVMGLPTDVQPCSVFQEKLPNSVIEDFELTGLNDNQSVPCWR